MPRSFLITNRRYKTPSAHVDDVTDDVTDDDVSWSPSSAWSRDDGSQGIAVALNFTSRSACLTSHYTASRTSRQYSIHNFIKYWLIRRPGNTVPDGLMFYPWRYLFFRHAFSEVPQPIGLKLCHMVRIWLNFITPLQKFGGHSPKKIGSKTCNISVNFVPLQTLIANISGTRQHYYYYYYYYVV